MKIGLPSDGQDLSAYLTSAFERCQYFIIVSLDGEEQVISVLNDAQTASRGAEIQVAQLLVDQRVEIVITPQIDKKALYALQIAGIQVYLGNAGNIQDNIDAYRQGRLVEIKGSEQASY